MKRSAFSLLKVKGDVECLQHMSIYINYPSDIPILSFVHGMHVTIMFVKILNSGFLMIEIL
jgi:hypothetical protein